jgi:hypothetical protein
MFRDITLVYIEIHGKNINTKAALMIVKADGSYSYHTCSNG